MGQSLGLLMQPVESWFSDEKGVVDQAEIEELIAARKQARENKNWEEADNIRHALDEKGVILEDTPDGATTWRLA